ncbi:hypothetical protein J6590_007324 [Homalodisca vitripennis]|nr:hypothetical protein J6590_007324 [Homalodisca vitripennis]
MKMRESDTTSATFHQSKLVFAELLKKESGVADAGEIFNNPSATHKQIAEQPNNCFLKWYDAPEARKTFQQIPLRHIRQACGECLIPDVPSLPLSEG